MKTVLAPIDFSAATSLVIEEAAQLAASLSAEVVLFHCVPPPTVKGDYGLPMEDLQEVTDAAREAADLKLKEALALLTDKGIKATYQLTSGGAAASIVSAANDINAAYIIMGSHGHTALYDLLVGTTHHAVLKDSPCPVVIVPPAPDGA